MAEAQATQTAESAIAPIVDSEGLPAGERLSLAEMSRIMDVAATLRREQEIVNQQLNIDQIKAKLRERLLEAAKVSGDPVTEAEVAVAVEQYYERLHEFREPPASFAKFLAHVWVRRGPILKAAAAIVVALGVIWGLLAAGILPGKARTERMAAQRAAAVRAEFAAIERSVKSIEQIAKEPAAVADAQDLLAAARAASEAGDAQKLHATAGQLGALLAALESEYTIVLASGQGEQTGFDRISNETGQVSGYYVILDARDASGRPVLAPIENRETGKIEAVSRWAEQVPQEVYDRLKADKQADGVLDEHIFGVKRRGVREAEVTLPDATGAPLKRTRQLTSWPET
jgi:hypothetical protein